MENHETAFLRTPLTTIPYPLITIHFLSLPFQRAVYVHLFANLQHAVHYH
jgi:hypothetical protein